MNFCLYKLVSRNRGLPFEFPVVPDEQTIIAVSLVPSTSTGLCGTWAFIYYLDHFIFELCSEFLSLAKLHLHKVTFIMDRFKQRFYLF